MCLFAKTNEYFQAILYSIGCGTEKNYAKSIPHQVGTLVFPVRERCKTKLQLRHTKNI